MQPELRALVRADQNHMATTFEFKIVCPAAHVDLASNTLDEAHALVTRLESELSEFLIESPVWRFNHTSAYEKIFAPKSLIEILEISKRMFLQSDGQFNCFVKSRAGAKNFSSIAWDQTHLWKTDSELWLSFGAIGKGYALDQVACLIESRDFKDFSLSAGGSSVLLSGSFSPEKPWNWAWSWRKSGAQENLGLEFSHSLRERIAIGVSGIQEKGEHILFSGNSSPSFAQSALVACASAAEADALSTAHFIAPISLSTPCARIDSQGVASWNGAFQRIWGAICAAATFVLFGMYESAARADDTVDLSALGLDSFNPYVIERNSAWVALPILILLLTVLHLRKNKVVQKKEQSHDT